jgi:hypothetical protein
MHQRTFVNPWSDIFLWHEEINSDLQFHYEQGPFTSYIGS